MIHKKRKYTASIALAALFLFSPLLAMAYEAPSFEYDSSLELSYAGRMAQDIDGNVYVADARQGRVYVFDKYGRSIDTVNTIAQPAAVAAGSAGEVYVASPHGVYLLGDNGQVSSIVGQAEIDSPVDMAVDGAGQIYLLDSGTRSVKVYSSAGVQLGEFAGGAAKYPVSIAIARDSISGEELIYVGYSVETTDADNTEIVMAYDTSYNLVRSIGATVTNVSWRSPLPPSGEVLKASGLAVDSVGRVYVADNYGSRIDVYSEQGDFLMDYSVGLDSAPVAVLFDLYGRLFVSLLSGSVKVLSVDGQNVANAVPTAPSLLSPTGGMRIDSSSPELVAGNSLDLNSDSLVYEFDVASDVFMSDNVWSSGPLAEGADGSTSAAVAIALSEDADYYWRVRSFDGIEYSRYSYVTRFFVNALNSVPVIESYSPSIDNVVGVNVGDAIDFGLTSSDSDRDQLAITWFLNGVEVLSGSSYSYLAEISDVGENIIKVVVEDSELSVQRQWVATVMRPNTPPTAPAVNLPGGSEDVFVLKPELSVSNSYDAEGDALVYTFEVSKKDNFSDVVATVSDVPAGPDFTSATVDVDLEENAFYYWRAKACEVAVGGDFVAEYYCSDPSGSGTFVVNTVNDPVGAPSIASPSDATHVNTIERQFSISVDNALELDINDVLLYDFELAADPAFSSVLSRYEGVVEGASGSTSVEISESLDENSTYYWRARAADATTTSAWVSASFFVDNYNDAPTVPYLDSPLTGAETVSLNPVLSVLNAQDLNGDNISYIFEVDSVHNFSSDQKQNSGLVAEADQLTSWLPLAALADNTRFYWRVKASDGLSESAWSAVNDFFVNVSNDAPTAPVVKAPSGGIAVSVDRPELSVYGATDLDGDRLAYAYQLSRSDSFSKVELVSGEEGLAWIVDANLEENATYFWRSTAIDEHGLSGAWSTPGEFMVNVVNENPGVPGVGTYTLSSGDELLLQIGSAVDPDGDSLSYFVEIYSDRAMTALSYSEEIIPVEEQVLCNAGVLAPKVYYWRVRAYDGEIFGSWSDTRIIRVNASGSTAGDRADKAQGHKRN